MWRQRQHQQEIIDYVRDFRVAHDVDLAKPRPFETDDLSEAGQYLLGELVNTPEFEGPWKRLEDDAFASQVAECVHLLRPRLEAYIARKGA